MMRGGAYRIVGAIGRGGMGAVYLAADTGAFDRKCVVKELLDYYDPTDPDEARQAQERFETEARLLAELSHPGIPRIYSYFSEAGRHYIVMEYIEGETLERAVDHVDSLGHPIPARPLSAEEVVRHAVRVCRVLEYLGDQPTAVVHQDIKPANLIVDRNSGEVRLVDFGTARTRTRWATQIRLRQGASSLFGTEGYAAPEQYQGLSEPRSDVYALASTTYHLMTGDDPADHPFQFPELATLPSVLADALSRALRLEVQRRSSPAEFRHALGAWLIPDDRGQPFVFRSGAVAHTTAEMVSLCDQNWATARRHLVDGDFDRWFRDRNRHDLVAKAQSSRLEADADAALEAFLRRLDPRLPPPRLVVEPQSLDFGWVARSRRDAASGDSVYCQFTVRNEGRGYAQARCTASVPWLVIEPEEVGCLVGDEVELEVRINAAALPLRRDHQAILSCSPARGARVSIPVTAKLSIVREAAWRTWAGLRVLLKLTGLGARRGLALWTRAFGSLVRSRSGPWVLVAETLVLAVVMVALWSNWTGMERDLTGLAWIFVQALPLALVAVYLLPALGFVAGAVAWEIACALVSHARGSRGAGSSN